MELGIIVSENLVAKCERSSNSGLPLTTTKEKNNHYWRIACHYGYCFSIIDNAFCRHNNALTNVWVFQPFDAITLLRTFMSIRPSWITNLSSMSDTFIIVSMTNMLCAALRGNAAPCGCLWSVYLSNMCIYSTVQHSMQLIWMGKFSLCNITIWPNEMDFIS